MTSALQNRLVGTIIVVALVVIVLPEFLDGEKRVNKQEFVTVPPMSDIVEVNPVTSFDTESVSDQLDQPVEIVDDTALDDNLDGSVAKSDVTTSDMSSKLANTALQNTDASVKKNQPSEQNNSTQSSSAVANINQSIEDINETLDEIDIKDSGWVVQLGSFRHEKNVKELLKTLTDAGYRAYSRPVMTSVGELNKVFVGPELEKQTLELALPHLQQLTKLKGKITPFEVSAG